MINMEDLCHIGNFHYLLVILIVVFSDLPLILLYCIYVVTNGEIIELFGYLIYVSLCRTLSKFAYLSSYGSIGMVSVGRNGILESQEAGQESH